MDVAVHRHSLDPNHFLAVAGRQPARQPASSSGLLGLWDRGERWKRPFAKDVSSVYLKDRVIPPL